MGVRCGRNLGNVIQRGPDHPPSRHQYYTRYQDGLPDGALVGRKTSNGGGNNNDTKTDAHAALDFDDLSWLSGPRPIYFLNETYCVDRHRRFQKLIEDDEKVYGTLYQRNS